MANKLDIHVNVDANQTVSKFSVAQNGHVTFHNDAGAKLTVNFGAPLVLCRGSNPQSSIEVLAGRKEQLQVCNAADGNSFKYTATVDGAAPEDPIVIIEKSGYDPSLVASAGVVAATVVLTALVTRAILKSRWKGQKT